MLGFAILLDLAVRFVRIGIAGNAPQPRATATMSAVSARDDFMKYLRIVNGLGVRSASLNDGAAEATLEASVPTIQKRTGFDGITEPPECGLRVARWSDVIPECSK